MNRLEQDSNMNADVVVIGGGQAGMTAALRAAQGGRKVCLLEKSTQQRYLCNTRISGGIFHCAQMDILTDPAQLKARILEITGGAADEKLAGSVAENGIRGVRWLQDQGIRFMKGVEAYHNFILAPPVIMADSRQWEGRGGDVLLRTLEAALIQAGGEIRRGHDAQRLHRPTGEACTGVSGVMANGDAFELSAGAVVIADGGFQCNPDRLRGVVSAAPEKLFQRNARSGVGDGLRMAQEIGAAITSLGGFYGHVLSRDAFTNDALWPYRWLDFVAAAGMVVDAAGQRFCDEGLGGVHIANSIAALADPLSATVIADSRIWAERGTYNMLPPNPSLVRAGGTVLEAATLDELAAKASLAREGFLAQVERYNQAVATGQAGGLAPVRSEVKFKAYPLLQAPFFAFPVCAGITYTMGGIRIDEHSRVLDANGAAIEGLYAAGATTGGIEGGPMPGYVGGLIKSLVTGLHAGEALAAGRRASVLNR